MNELFLLNSNSKHVFEKNILHITEVAFHPCKPFFHGKYFIPESFPSIYTKGVFEITLFLREVIKKTDYLLAPQGELIIDYFMPEEMYVGGEYLRPLSFFLYEFSLAVGDRFKLKEKEINGRVCHLRFEKTGSSLPNGDTIDRWSFGIVSDGRKNDRVNSIIQQVQSQGIPEYEILICGPRPGRNLPTEVRVFDDSDLYRDIRPPITAKKNRLIKESQYNNLVLIHDRIYFPQDWYERIKSYGNFFEILCVQILDEETQSRRVQDWLTMNGDFNNYRTAKGGLLEYDDWHPDIYVDGGCLIAKKHKLEPTLYNERLHWGEAEDVDLSRRLYQNGVMTNCYKDCFVTTATRRHPGKELQESVLAKLKTKIGLRTKIKKRQLLRQQKSDFGNFLNLNSR